MKSIILFALLTLLATNTLFAQTDFDLEPSQSMLMTGKGPGQDATINPYDGQDCYALVTNIGKEPFSIRIQQKGKNIKTIPISKAEIKKVTLLKGYELYLDANDETDVKARVTYEKME